MSGHARFSLLLALPLAVAAGNAAAASLEVQVRTPAGLALADAAVVLEPSVPSHVRNRARAVIAQHGSEFVPWVTVVQTGTQVEFPNEDAIKHHVYSFSPPKRFEIKLYAGKPGQPVAFDKPGQIDIGCNIHDWMEAHVLVVESPWFAKTGADGKAAIDGLPAGHYRLKLWHPLQKGAGAAREIDVGATPARLNLVLDAGAREPRPHTEGDPQHY